MATENGAIRPARWARWAGFGGLALAAGPPLVAVAMALLTGQGLLSWETSLGALRNLSYAAMAGGGLALIAVIALAIRRHWRWTLFPLVGIALAALFVATLTHNFGKAEIVPPIHDITTDLDDPPGFETLPLRADNFEVIPDGDDPALAALDNAARWRVWHERGYGDLAPLIVRTNVADTVAAAERLVAGRGWELARADRAAGRVEATATVSLYRFRDDVALRIVPEGAGSRVDMRSVSRVGVSDLGVNGERVRGFLADLREATAAEGG